MPTFKKKDQHAKLMKCLKQIKFPDTRIVIDKEHFDVHLIVLQEYSQYFNYTQGVRNTTAPRYLYELSSVVVPMWAFKQLYYWMLENDAYPKRSKIMRVLFAASYLEMQAFVHQCCQIFQNPELTKEPQAFLLYQEAKECNMNAIVNLCLKRVSAFFLPLVSSLDFLQMPIDDLVFLLNSNAIYTHDEMEVFFAAVRWLNYDWNERMVYVLQVMKCVRFTLMPHKCFVYLHNPCVEIEVSQITRMPELAQIIEDAGIYIMLAKAYKHNPNPLKKVCQDLDLQTSINRYLDQNRTKTQFSSYYTFLRYIQKLTNKPINFFEGIQDEPVNDDEQADAYFPPPLKLMFKDQVVTLAEKPKSKSADTKESNSMSQMVSKAKF